MMMVVAETVMEMTGGSGAAASSGSNLPSLVSVGESYFDYLLKSPLKASLLHYLNSRFQQYKDYGRRWEGVDLDTEALASEIDEEKVTPAVVRHIFYGATKCASPACRLRPHTGHAHQIKDQSPGQFHQPTNSLAYPSSLKFQFPKVNSTGSSNRMTQVHFLKSAWKNRVHLFCEGSTARVFGPRQSTTR